MQKEGPPDAGASQFGEHGLGRFRAVVSIVAMDFDQQPQAVRREAERCQAPGVGDRPQAGLDPDAAAEQPLDYRRAPGSERLTDV